MVDIIPAHPCESRDQTAVTEELLFVSDIFYGSKRTGTRLHVVWGEIQARSRYSLLEPPESSALRWSWSISVGPSGSIPESARQLYHAQPSVSVVLPKQESDNRSAALS